MYDQNLVLQTTAHLSKSIANRNQITENLYEVNNILPDFTYNKLMDYINSANAPWTEQETKGYRRNPLRSKVSWDPDTVIEEIADSFAGLSGTIAEMLGVNVEFLGITLWKDAPGYDLEWHTDNEILIATFQTYLNSFSNPGTTFMIDDKEYECKFLPNTGYIACQHNVNKPLHKLNTVKNERYSLFAMWGKPGSKLK